MGRNGRRAYYDRAFGMEGFSFQGIMQSFPNHFHDHYVIGCIERGERRMACGNREYLLRPGDLVLFSPGVNHACESLGNTPFSYHCFNLKPETVREAFRRVSGEDRPPSFVVPMARDGRLSGWLAALSASFSVSGAVSDEGGFTAFLDQVAGTYCALPPGSRESVQDGSAGPDSSGGPVETACRWMRRHYAEPVSLRRLGEVAGMNSFTLLRAFVRTRGITPYRYLETLRIAGAREFLEQGVEPAHAAILAGFTDQSHFTRHFKRMTGLTPGAYRKIFSGSAD